MSLQDAKIGLPLSVYCHHTADHLLSATFCQWRTFSSSVKGGKRQAVQAMDLHHDGVCDTGPCPSEVVEINL